MLDTREQPTHEFGPTDCTEPPRSRKDAALRRMEQRRRLQTQANASVTLLRKSHEIHAAAMAEAPLDRGVRTAGRRQDERALALLNELRAAEIIVENCSVGPLSVEHRARVLALLGA